jgi:large subunit ribosomal protein L5
MSYSPRLKDKYRQEIIPALTEKFQYSTVMQVPKLLKISVNQGLGTAIADKKLIDAGLMNLLPLPVRKP